MAMARPIKETPILFGEDARRFEALMMANKKDPVERARLLKVYEIGKKMLERGEKMHFPKVRNVEKD
ncbi:hypothetical protein [Fibrobacter sp.]|uniref:hypothetical protein n=1 Tax=Fibrobacter sp. TaxID=35828 RepID=UPI0025BF5386|nr:hypothetical protein [Fibrobacter sp.]